MGQGERLAYYIDKQGFTKKDFCNKYELEYNSMVMIMAEKRTMGIIVLNRLHEIFPNMNVHWLLYGEGLEEVNSEILNSVNEPQFTYRREDKFESLILNYLEKSTIKKKIHEIIQEK